MSAEIGNLVVVIQTDSRKFDAGMSKSKASLDGFTGAARIAAGVLMRDLVRGVTGAAIESIKLGARFADLSASFQRLKGATRDEALSLETLTRATRGTVAEVDLLRAANTGLALGLPTKELNELFEASQIVGASLGIDTLQAVNSITYGMGRMSVKWLDNLGIVVKADAAYTEYAETLGKTVGELTEAERRMAFNTAAMDALRSKAALLEGTTSEGTLALGRFNAALRNVQTRIGELLVPLAGLTPAFQAMAPAVNILAVTYLPKLTASLHSSVVAAGGLKVALMALITNPVTLAIVAMGLLAAAWINNWAGIKDATMPFIEWLDKALRNIAQAMTGVTKGFGKIFGGKTPVLTTPPMATAAPELYGQHGLDTTVYRPTRIIAGEGGRPEHVKVTPLGGAGAPTAGAVGGAGGGIHFHIGTFIGLDEASAKRLFDAAAEYHIEELDRRGVRQ